MKLKEIFDSMDLNTINEYIENAVQEDYFLEFKTANYPNSNGMNDDNKHFSNVLSSFSNSGGGILVWGILAKKNSKNVDAASEKRAIGNVRAFESHLKRLEGTQISPQINGVMYKSILEDGENGYLVVYIPRSENAPHMAKDKHYYKRSGDSSYKCEHYDIMDIMGRKRYPNISVFLSDPKIRYDGHKNGLDIYSLELIVTIRNLGGVTAKFIKLKVNYNKHSVRYQYGIDGNRTTGLISRATTNHLEMEYYGALQIVLHPNEFLEIDKIMLTELHKGESTESFKIDYSISAEDFPIQSGELIVPSVTI